MPDEAYAGENRLCGRGDHKEYLDDTPYPSRLVLGWIGTRPIHVVAANTAGGETIIVTVYEPDPAQWDADFKRKRP